MTHEVSEKDLRAPEFRDGSPDEYERRSDGKIVRKDRFVRGMQDIAAILFGCRHQYEIDEVVTAVHRLNGIQLEKAIVHARDIYEGEPKALECLDYLHAVLDAAKKPVVEIS
jgi:hypothetical protein